MSKMKYKICPLFRHLFSHKCIEPVSTRMSSTAAVSSNRSGRSFRHHFPHRRCNGTVPRRIPAIGLDDSYHVTPVRYVLSGFPSNLTFSFYLMTIIK